MGKNFCGLFPRRKLEVRGLNYECFLISFRIRLLNGRLTTLSYNESSNDTKEDD